MAESYYWVNIDRKEYIDPGWFDCYDNDEYMHKDSMPIHALHTLLLDEWKGNHIFWMGNNCRILETEKFPNEFIQRHYEWSVEWGRPGYFANMILDTYKDVSGLFEETEEDIREEISDSLDQINQICISLVDPFKELFHKTARRCKYTIDHSKKIYYALDETIIRSQDHTIIDDADPLPLLMGYVQEGYAQNIKPGEWLGDVIGVSDQRPEGYLFIKELYVNW